MPRRSVQVILRERLERLGLTQRAFGERLQQTQGLTSQIFMGIRKVPPDKAGAWADALQLDGDERDEWIAAVQDADSHQGTVARLESLEAKAERLEMVLLEVLRQRLPGVPIKRLQEVLNQTVQDPHRGLRSLRDLLQDPEAGRPPAARRPGEHPGGLGDPS